MSISTWVGGFTAGTPPTPPPIPSLNALTLSTSTATEDTATSIGIIGTTTGSTLSIAAGSLPAGLALDSPGRTINGTPTVLGESFFTLRETLAGASNTPRDTNLSIEVTDSTGPDFTLSNATVTTAWGVEPVGELVPNGATPAGAYFVLVGNPAGFAVENG